MSDPLDLPPWLRKLVMVLHRDIGYLLSALLIGYCLSGLALNHIDDWNPDFIVEKRELNVGAGLTRAQLDDAAFSKIAALVGEGAHRVIDFPTSDHVKIYYAESTLQVHLSTGVAEYERVTRRPLFYGANVLHRNTIDGWKWVSDLFAVALITLNLTGLVLLKGRNGLGGRGKWLVLAGLGPPLIALLIHEITGAAS